MKIPLAYAAGEDFHTNPYNSDYLPDYPDHYYRNLDFSDLIKNAKWAKRIYDNPGVDTDGDGYAGEIHICVYDSSMTDSGWVITKADTFYYTGDGIPDWKAAAPPPPPVFWIEPTVNGLRIRFNGSSSETEKDIFSKIVDFEGYRIYLGRDEREASFSLVASFDNPNYDKYVWNPAIEDYELRDIPFTLDSLRCLNGKGTDPCNDSTFNPLQFNRRTLPFVHPSFPESLFYFQPHEYNVSLYPEETPIRKIYPDAPDPRNVPPESLTTNYYTDDGYFKYFEYEFTIVNLLPTVPYWVNVTVFDFGSPASGLHPLETSKTVSPRSAFPLGSQDRSDSNTLRVYVYPNPYRIDADYRGQGYEGRTEEDRPDYRVRAIHFVNLPPKCTISIFSLDGDMVRRLEHDVDPSDPSYSHHEWNLITRNTEMVVSGLYYWTVEAEDGTTQMGKLVIIM